MNIENWLRHTKINHLDAELLLAHVLKKRREWVLAHTETKLTLDQTQRLDLLAKEVQQGKPLAYITGHKEFYGRNFKVTPDTLIPRPETEDIIESVLSLPPEKTKKILDIGTGSGCIAITLSLELSNVQVTAVDTSQKALKVAKKNAITLDAKVIFLQSDLLKNITKSNKFDVIVANLPYVDQNWQVSPGTAYEPKTALFADDGGLQLIRQLIEQSPDHLSNAGYLALEADTRQHESITEYASQHGFKLTQIQGLAMLFQVSSER